MTFLASISRKGGGGEGFPFGVRAIRTLETLDVETAVTFFVGENGSGKSTLLEGIALAAGLPTVGADDLHRDGTLDAQRRLARALRLAWAKKIRRGFFLRAEDFFGFVKRLQRERVELKERLLEIDREYEGRSDLAIGLAKGPVIASLGAMTASYGKDLDANSHGESFLKLFQSRFVPGGLYLLDEPEAALSPQSQLALIAMMMEMVKESAQFIVATHSPIVLAYPGARIYDFDQAPIAPVSYEELRHVNLTRDFLNERERYLLQLRNAVEGDGSD